MNFRQPGFTVGFQRQPQVSLAGRSKREETRQEILERTRREREERKALRQRVNAATVIQVGMTCCDTKARTVVVEP